MYPRVSVIGKSICFGFLSFILFGNVSAKAQNKIRSIFFINSGKENNPEAKAKLLLDGAAKSVGFISGNIMESVSGKDQLLVSMLWEGQKNYALFKDSLERKNTPKPNASKDLKGGKSKKIFVKAPQHLLIEKISSEVLPDNEKIKGFKVNDYASLTLWTINNEVEELFLQEMFNLFSHTKKQKGFHFGEYGVEGTSVNKLLCFTFWDSKESLSESTKQLKLKIKKKENLSLLSKDLLEKKPENKRYKVILVK